jgi:hypothetical protein
MLDGHFAFDAPEAGKSSGKTFRAGEPHLEHILGFTTSS